MFPPVGTICATTRLFTCKRTGTVLVVVTIGTCTANHIAMWMSYTIKLMGIISGATIFSTRLDDWSNYLVKIQTQFVRLT